MSNSAPQQFFTPMRSKDLLFVDLETSSLNPDRGEILEFAAVRTDANVTVEKMVAEYKCTMKHPEWAEAKALEVNGYNEREWRNAIDVRVACAALIQMISDENVIWIGQNPHFDFDFERATFKREGLVLPQTKYLLDIASMAWPLCVAGKIERIKLETVCNYYGVPNSGSHRAMADVRRSIEVYRRMTRPSVPIIERTQISWDE